MNALWIALVLTWAAMGYLVYILASVCVVATETHERLEDLEGLRLSDGVIANDRELKAQAKALTGLGKVVAEQAQELKSLRTRAGKL